MKTIATLLLCCMTSLHTMAGGSDKWFTIGARGNINLNTLLNPNFLKDDGIKHKLTNLGGSGGAMLGFHYNEFGAINFEVLFTSFNQVQKSAIDSIKWSSDTHLRYLEFPILLHFDIGFKYIETGIKISSLKKAYSNYKNESISPAIELNDVDAKPDFQKSNLSFIFGWGSAIWGNGGLLMSTGIRITYGIKDITADKDQGLDYSTKTVPPTVLGYKGTHTASIGFHISFDFDLGYMMSSSCGRSHKFVLFKH